MITLVRFLLGCLQVPLAPFTGPYRVFTYRPGALGGVARMFALWVGVVMGFPLYHDSFSTVFPLMEHNGVSVWYSMMMAALIHTIVKCTGRFPLGPEKARSWFGTWEAAYAISLSAVAHSLAGLGLLFLISYACSLADRGLAITRDRLARWSPDDTAWCMTPFRVAIAFFAPGALTTFGLIKRCIKLFFPAKTPVVEGQVPARPPGFMNRVMSHMVSSVILSTMMSGISWSLIWNVLGIALAIPLALMGWKISAPEAVKKQSAEIFRNADVTNNNESAEFAERMRAEAERIRAELRERREAAGDRLNEAKGQAQAEIAGRREQLTEEVGRAKRKALWGVLGW